MVLMAGIQPVLAAGDSSAQNDMYAQMIKAATQQAVDQAKKEKFNAAKAIKFIQSALKDVDGIRYRTAGNLVIIEGEVVKEDDRKKLEDICGQFKGNVLNWVKLSEAVRTGLAKNVERLISVPSVSINLIGEKTIIEGMVNTENEKIRINKLAKSFFPEAINMLQVASKKVLVELRVQIVEMQEQFSRNIGFNYGVEGEEGKTGYVKTSMNFNHGSHPGKKEVIGTVEKSGVEETLTEFISTPNPQWMDSFDAWFKALQSKGKVKIIAEPKIVTLSGKSATISKGGSLTYLSQYGTDTVEYGLKLDVAPNVDVINNTISTTVNVEMSEPSTSVAGANTNISKTSASTEIILKNGETIVISGLLKLNESKTRSEIPFLAGIPVIGEFLRYREKKIDDSKLLVFVTPRVVEVFDEGMKYLEPGEGEEQAGKQDGFVFGKMNLSVSPQASERIKELPAPTQEPRDSRLTEIKKKLQALEKRYLK